MLNLYKILIISFLSFILISCSNDSSQEKEDNFSKKVTFAIHGIVMDQGLHESALLSLEKAHSQLGFQIAYQTMDKPSDFSVQLENIYSLNNDIIFSVDFTLWEAMYEQAVLHPEQKYIVIDYTDKEISLDNLLTVGFRSEEGAFLAGYLAAKTSQTGKIGFIGGVRGTIIDMFDYGYEAGAKYANPDIIIVNKYSEDFNNPTLGKTLATYLYQNDVDVIFHASGATGLGIIESAKEIKNNSLKQVWVIGVDDDQSPLGLEVVLTSVLKRVDNVIYSLLESYERGAFQGSSSLELGLKEGALEIIESPFLSEALVQEIKFLSQKIEKGEIKIPYNKKTMEDFSNFYLN